MLEEDLEQKIINLCCGLPPLIESRNWKNYKSTNSKWEWKKSKSHPFSIWQKVQQVDSLPPFMPSSLNDAVLQQETDIQPATRLENSEMYNGAVPSQNECLDMKPRDFEEISPLPPILTPVLTYTDEEYHQTLKNPNWTKEETDLLMETCSFYNLKWHVIRDRMEGDRSVEDIRQRYYQVNRLLLNARHIPEEALLYSYDSVKGASIQNNLRNLLSRSSQQIQEEDLLMCEAIKFQNNMDRWNAERDRLYKTHSSSIDVAMAFSEKANGFKKRKNASFRGARKEKDEDLLKADEVPAGIIISSSRVPAFKPAMQAKINACLEEFGIPLKPKIPTTPILETFEQVVSAAHSLVSARKFQERIMHDLKIAKMNKRTLEADILAEKAEKTKQPLNTFDTPALVIIRRDKFERCYTALLGGTAESAS